MNLITRMVLHRETWTYVLLPDIDGRCLRYVDNNTGELREVPSHELGYDTYIEVEQFIVLAPSRPGQQIEIKCDGDEGGPFVVDLLGWKVDMNPDRDLRGCAQPIVAPSCEDEDAMGLITHPGMHWRVL